jgi:hypothetical protein
MFPADISPFSHCVDGILNEFANSYLRASTVQGADQECQKVRVAGECYGQWYVRQLLRERPVVEIRVDPSLEESQNIEVVLGRVAIYLSHHGR